MSEEITIKVLKMENFTKRLKDLPKVHWFSMPIDLLTHPDFFRITGDEFKAFVWVVGIAAKMKNDTVRMSIDHTEHLLHIKSGVVNSMINKLQGKQLDVALRPHQGRTEASTLHNITEQYKTEQEEGTVVVEPPPAQQSNEFLIQNISATTQMRWRALYDDDSFLKAETQKALIYYEANPRKTPKTTKGWTMALNSWFARGWDYRAKATPGQKPGGFDVHSVDLSKGKK